MSKYFSKQEYTCGCGCGFDELDDEVLEAADKIRDYQGPTSCSSGCRCPKHNASVGGAAASFHLPFVDKDHKQKFRGRAMDLKCGDPQNIGRFVRDSLPHISFICYPSWIHIDNRDGKRLCKF